MIHHCFSEVAEQIMIIIKVKMKKPNTSPRWYSIWEYFWRLLKLLYTCFSDKASSLLYRKATALKSPAHAVWSLTSPTLNNHNIQDCQISVTSWIHTVDSCMATVKISLMPYCALHNAYLSFMFLGRTYDLVPTTVLLKLSM